jgi:hypothetical protein
VANAGVKDTRVYVAAPYYKGDQIVNVRNAINAAQILVECGYVPFVPHLYHFWHFLWPSRQDQWKRLDIHWLRCCQVLIRLPGESEGADMEVKLAKQYGIPVYYSVEEFLKAEGVIP